MQMPANHKGPTAVNRKHIRRRNPNTVRPRVGVFQGECHPKCWTEIVKNQAIRPDALASHSDSPSISNSVRSLVKHSGA